MLQIKQLLSRFKNITNTEKEKKQIIVDIFIKNEIPISIKNVYISKNTIFTKVNPIIKTEIYLKKQNILLEIKELNIFQNIIDIQ